MSKYTVKQVESLIHEFDARCFDSHLRLLGIGPALSAYAAALRQQGDQAGGVPDGFFTDLQQAKNTAERSSKIDRLRVYGRVVEKHINALLAAAPSQPEESK